MTGVCGREQEFDPSLPPSLERLTLIANSKYMNTILKEHLVSALHTFVAAFIMSFAATVNAGGITWTASFWGSVLLAAIVAGGRAVVKELFARLAPQSLGGRAK